MGKILLLKSKGFTLVEMSVVLIVIGILTTISFVSYRTSTENNKLDKTRSILTDAKEALINFAADNHRLPCPDTTGNGFEATCTLGVGPITGDIPYRTMLLDAAVVDAWNRLIKYTVYRNTAPNGDLVVLTEQKNAIGGLNLLDRLDFCVTLDNAASAAASNARASVSTLPTGTGCSASDFVNMAFVLVSGGIGDADGDVSPLDDENNAGTAACDASPEKAISASYDDLVVAAGINEISGRLCQ